MKREYGLWEKDACDRCGIVFQVTRTRRRIIEEGKKLLCGECQAAGLEQLHHYARSESTALQDGDLTGVDLRGADLRGSDLRDTDLRGADFTGATLDEASLRTWI